jgi:murein DD-endopeptidase MepM/ murein hydrolase activator NlpD
MAGVVTKTFSLILAAVLWVFAAGGVRAAPGKAAGRADTGSTLLLTVTPATIRQGGAAVVGVRTATRLTRVRVRFAGRSWPLYPAENGWQTIVGTDPTSRPGSHQVRVEATGPTGVILTARRPLTVTPGKFARRRITFDPRVAAVLTPEAAERERRAVQRALRVLHTTALWRGPLAIPVQSRVSSPYGVLSIYGGVVRGFHGGTDFAAPAGAPVRASAPGIVRLAEELPLSGNAVMVDHGLGVVTSYLHMSSIAVDVGQRVAAGSVVGQVGSTGLATGPHLHWGLRVNGVRVDPMLWIRR